MNTIKYVRWFLLMLFIPLGAWSQIFVTRIDLNRIEAYNFDGTFISGLQLGGLNSPQGIAVTSSHIFVVNSPNSTTGTIGKYNLDGTVVNATLISGVSVKSEDIAVFGSSLYVGNGHKISEYSLDGTLINDSRVTLANGHVLRGITVSSLGIFVVDQDTLGGSGLKIGAYNLDGTTNNASLITGLTSPRDVAISGARLFVSDDVLGRVSEYNAIDGSTVILNRITSGVGGFLAVSETSLYFIGNVGNVGTIGEYKLDGSFLNTTLISGVPGALGISVLSSVPEPSTYAAVFGLITLGFAAYRRHKKLG
jgi:hypothetical protein